MKKMSVWALFWGLFCLTGCDYIAERVAEHGPAVVQVGKSRLTLADLREMIPSWDSLSTDEQAKQLKAWVDEELLYQAALDSKIDDNPDVAKAVENAKRKIITTAYLSAVNDSIKVSKEEVHAYYESHQQDFLRGRYRWTGVIVSYPKWDIGYEYFKAKKNERFTDAPKMDYRIKSIEPFENVLETPDSCLAADLRKVETGVLEGFKVCGRSLKSLIVLSFEDSAAVKPFDEVADEAMILTRLEKRKARMEDLRLELKKKTPVFADWKPSAKEE